MRVKFDAEKLLAGPRENNDFEIYDESVSSVQRKILFGSNDYLKSGKILV